jgi:hypothetical protein
MAGTSTIQRAELVRQLGATVGLAKAQEAIDLAATDLHLPTAELSQDQALKLLETLSAAPSVLGIAARCLKVRAMLTFGK